MMRKDNDALRQSLIRVAQGLNEIVGSLPDNERKSCDGVISALNRSVIPQLSSDCPIIVAVTGGGSTGKSTIFNFLAGKEISASDPRAGYTKRMVAAIHPKVADDTKKMALLFERFRKDAKPQELSKPEEALEKGEPVYDKCESIPEHLVLVDTPDFDTGTREGFTNRDAAKEILDVADVVLYVATNATYNNKSSTDFIRSVLSEIGVRKVALLYRFSPVYDDDMVRDHMTVLLSNLYPDKRMAKEACIGIWRIDESNEVPAGKSKPEIRPINGGSPLADVLAALDPTKTRTDVMRSAIDKSLRHADTWVQEAEIEALKYVVYRDSFKFLTSVACKNSLELAPQRDVIKLFEEEWENAQPWMVRNGHWLSRTVRKTAKKVVGMFRKDGAPSNDDGQGFSESVRSKFLDNAQKLRNNRDAPCVRFEFPKNSPDMQRLVEALRTIVRKFPDDYSLEDKNPKREDGNYAVKVSRPAVVDGGGNTKSSVRELFEDMSAKAVKFVGETESLRPDIRNLVLGFREKMTRWQSIKEWFSASLDTVAVGVGVTYVVATGDAFTGGTLMSMFGLNDLVAIPALSAFIAANAKVDKKTVEEQMNRLFTVWANGKVDKIRSIFEDGISGRDIKSCDKTAKRLDGALDGLKSALADAHQQIDVVFDK